MGVVSLVSIVADLWLAWQYVVFLRAARGSHSSLLNSATAKIGHYGGSQGKEEVTGLFFLFRFIHNLSDRQLHLHVSHVTVYQSMMQLATVTVFIFSS